MKTDDHVFNFNTGSPLVDMGLSNYINRGINPGSFLCCVLANDLFGAVAKADYINGPIIPDIVKEIFTVAPMSAFGSYDAITTWTNNKKQQHIEEGNKL